MPTNEERREVAARLRVLSSHREVDKELVEDALGLYMGECIDGYDPVSVMELADLIEPEPERTCRNKAVRNNKEFPPEYRTDNFICSACGALFFADSEYINHPIDWAFCPDCGAKVVGEGE